MNTYNVVISTTNFMKYHLKMISDAIIGYELVIICYICQYSLHMSLFFHNQLYLRCRYLQCNTNIELSMNLPLPYKEKGWKKNFTFNYKIDTLLIPVLYILLYNCFFWIQQIVNFLFILLTIPFSTVVHRFHVLSFIFQM